MKFNLSDIWNVSILGKHKHRYKRIEDAHINIATKGIPRTISFQRHQCATCKKIVGLEDWQIESLPTSMLYEKLPSKLGKINSEY